MAKKKKKTQLSSEGKTELAKAIAEKGQTFARTYARVEIWLSKFFRWISGWLDKLLFNQKHSKVIALILAFLFYVTLNSTNSNIFETSKSAEVLGNYKVSRIISEQAYEVSNLPSTVKVRIIGDLSDIKSVKQQKNFRVVADMTDLQEGVHEVKLSVESAPSNVEVVLEPSNAVVTIKKKSIRKFSVGYDFANRSKIDSIYDLSEPELQQGEVLVRASADTLDRIAYVKALIKVDENIQSDFETKAKVYAYDDNGNRMDVDILPDTLKATVKVTKPSKEVPVSIVPTGIIPDNKAIESYKLDFPKVMIYANEAILKNISDIPISIPASTLTSDRDFSMPIILPNGVSKISQNIVNISIKLGKMETKTMQAVPISFENKIDGLTYDFDSGVANNVEVTLKGTKNVIDEIEKESLKVYVDVSKIDKAGTYEQPLLVSGKNKLATYEIKDGTVKIKVSGKLQK
ncbi:MAG: CdaR family protein [Longicatena sp.]